MKPLLHASLSALLLAGATSPAFAVDGVVLIDQNRALAGNVTPGDAPGFPVTLSVPGSYRLSGNLTAPANTDGIVIAADFVTLDLNGFTLTGSGSGTGIFNGGIGRLGTVIRNGSVTRFFQGIDISLQAEETTSSSEVEHVRAFKNTGTGIAVGEHAIVHDTITFENPLGLSVGNNAVVTGNLALRNGNIGIAAGPNSLVSGNAAANNLGIGIFVQCPSNVIGNMAAGNAGNNANIFEIGSDCTFANNNPIP